MLHHIWGWIVSHTPRSERGQDLAEYGMLIGLIALVVVGAVIVLGGNLNTVFTAIAGQVGPWAP
jgi:pilus assembly protein Flp/PilA